MVALVAGSAAPLGAQGAARVPAESSARALAPVTASTDSSSLVVANRRVITFRAPLGALGPADRARAAHERIAALADSGLAEQVTARRVPEGVLVWVGAHPVFTITAGDRDPAREEALEELSGRVVDQLRLALRAAGEERSFGHTVLAIVLALVATAIALVVLRLLFVGRRLVRARLPLEDQGERPLLAVRGFTLLRSGQMLAVGRRLLDIVLWAAALFVTYLWLTFLLTRFAYSRPWGEALGGYLATTLGTLLLGFLAAIPGLFTVVLIFLIARALARVVSGFFAAVETGDVSVSWLHADTAQPTRRIVIALLWLFALVVAYPYLPGSDSSVFKGISVFIGVILSLGSTGLVNQAMSGLVLTYARALRVSDYVRIGSTEGSVTQLGLLSTHVRTPRNEEITVPNAVVVSSPITNYTRLSATEGVMLHTSVTIGYDAPWRQVHAMLVEAAARTPGVLPEPLPYVVQTALSDFYVAYELRARLERPEERTKVLSMLHENIQDVFNAYGVQIMSPHFEEQPHRAVVVPPDRWYEPPAPPPPPAADTPPSRTSPPGGNTIPFARASALRDSSGE